MRTAFNRVTLLKWTLAAAAFTTCSVVLHAQDLNQPEFVQIDMTGTWKPFPHFWETMFGSGRANLSLRDDYRGDLRATKQATGFTFVRFHAILDDENGVYDVNSQSQPIYNFSYVDQIYDGLLENGVKPFVEISFMPRKLAANLTPHPFWYKPLPSPPNDPAKWSALIEAFTRHLEDRYGKDEVQSWYFEVWNEPNIDFWDGVPKKETYFALYDVTAKAIKDVDATLRVGGPATAQAAWVDEFIAHCASNHIALDFVSSHIYGNENPVDVFGKSMPILRRDMVGAAVKKVYDQVQASAFPRMPIIWSEYNATYMNQPEVTDSAFIGPWLANNIRECDGMTSMMSYWTFSDVFEEQGVVKTPFYGGYGLIAERGIPKAAFHVFSLLHQLGDERLLLPQEDTLVTRTKQGHVVVALWNYAEPNQSIAAKTFMLRVRGAKAKHYRMQIVDPQHGSALAIWQQMGRPASPTRAQIAELKKRSQLGEPVTETIDAPITVPAQGLVVITIF
ncbi:MAG TPA: glycosyl hydrolase family 39 [Bryobacteraceae bacterium]|nr:glycosyl hydrolase family 39 [Bryobacteraceae bacterium]